MAKPVVPSVLLKTIAAALDQDKPVKRKEAEPKTGATEKQSIRPARTGIAHARGGNKGK